MPLFPGMFNGCIIDLNNTSGTKQPLSNQHILSSITHKRLDMGWLRLTSVERKIAESLV